MVPPQGSVDDIMEQVLKSDVEAVIISSALLPSKLARTCRDRGRNVILFNRVQADAGLSAVCADNFGDLFLVPRTNVVNGDKINGANHTLPTKKPGVTPVVYGSRNS